MFSDRFDVLISKIIFLKYKKKYYFDIFLNKKYFKLRPLSDFHVIIKWILLTNLDGNKQA
jgi:hypothetical protein